MDYVTRQFINLTKKLRKELRKALSHLGHALQQQTEAIREANKRDNAQGKPEQPPVTVRAELYVPENIEKDRKTHEDRQHRLQVWIVIGTWAAFLAASIYAFISWGIWQDTASQATIAGIASREARSASGKADLRAQAQLQTIEKQFQLDQRPFVTATCCTTLDITEALMAPTVGKVLNVSIDIKNIGKTPAFNFIVRRHLVFGEGVKDIHSDPPERKKSEQILSQAGPGIITTAVSVKNTYTATGLDSSELVQWDGNTPLVVFGRITYDDASGNHYCTPFAWHWLHKNTWANTIDTVIATTEKGHHPVFHKFPDMCPPQMSF